MSTTITLQDIYSPIESQVGDVPETILEILSTSNELSDEVIRYFFSGKGKLLRPAMTLLGSGLSDKEYTADEQKKLVELAASYEIFHAATLIHDDIIDSAYVRRNLPTINTKWNAQTAVLVGDFLHDKALGVIYKNGNAKTFTSFLETAGTVCDGEIHELNEKGNFRLSEEDYFEIIRKKTAVLLACALEAGGIYAGLSADETDALDRFGVYFGKAFQIVDDCLDCTGNEHEFGKTLGKDVAEGVLTLPVIRLLEVVGPEKSKEIIDIFSSDSNEEKLASILALIQEHDTVTYSIQKAREFSDLARAELERFPESDSKESLLKLLDYVLERSR